MRGVVLELSTLGCIDLRGPARADPALLLRQPRRLALLAYLALARPGRFYRRTTLLDLFWPELSNAHGRGALRQAIHVLRRILGEDILVSRGDDELALRPGALRVDALVFQQLLTAGAAAHALELYEGPLLPGLSHGGAPGFERWLEDERARLRALAVIASWRLATEAEANGDMETAVGWARLAVSHAEHDECGYRRLMALLARAGDRAGALAMYGQLVRRLARDFECPPSPETEALAARIRAHRLSPVPPAGDAGVTLAPIPR